MPLLPPPLPTSPQLVLIIEGEENVVTSPADSVGPLSPPAPPELDDGNTFQVNVTFTVGGDLNAFDGAAFRDALFQHFNRSGTAPTGVSLTILLGSVIVTATFSFSAQAVATLVAQEIAATSAAEMQASWFGGAFVIESVSTPTSLSPDEQAPLADFHAALNRSSEEPARSRVVYILVAAVAGMCTLLCSCYYFKRRTFHRRFSRVILRRAPQRESGSHGASQTSVKSDDQPWNEKDARTSSGASDPFPSLHELHTPLSETVTEVMHKTPWGSESERVREHNVQSNPPRGASVDLDADTTVGADEIFFEGTTHVIRGVLCDSVALPSYESKV